MDSLLQVTIVLDRLVEVWHCSLKYIFDDTFNDYVLLSCKFRVIEVTDSFQYDIFLQFFFFIVLIWVNTDLSINRIDLALGEALVIPKLVIQFTLSIFGLLARNRLNAVSEALSFFTLAILCDTIKALSHSNVFICSTLISR